jgi:hypothetical protein
VTARGISECEEHRIKKDDEICLKCHFISLCGVGIRNEKNRRKKEKVRFT